MSDELPKVSSSDKGYSAPLETGPPLRNRTGSPRSTQEKPRAALIWQAAADLRLDVLHNRYGPPPVVGRPDYVVVLDFLDIRKPALAAVVVMRCRAEGLKHDRRSVFVSVFLYPTSKC